MSLWNDVVDDDVYHCAGSESQGVRQQRSNEQYTSSAQNTGNWLHHSRQLAVPEAL